MPTDLTVTTIRAPADWLAELDVWAQREGLTRTAALLITSRVGRRALDSLELSPAQWERLIADE